MRGPSELEREATASIPAHQEEGDDSMTAEFFGQATTESRGASSHSSSDCSIHAPIQASSASTSVLQLLSSRSLTDLSHNENNSTTTPQCMVLSSASSTSGSTTPHHGIPHVEFSTSVFHRSTATDNDDTTTMTEPSYSRESVRSSSQQPHGRQQRRRRRRWSRRFRHPARRRGPYQDDDDDDDDDAGANPSASLTAAATGGPSSSSSSSSSPPVGWTTLCGRQWVALVVKILTLKARTPAGTLLELVSPVLMIIFLILAYIVSDPHSRVARVYSTVTLDFPGPWMDLAQGSLERQQQPLLAQDIVQLEWTAASQQDEDDTGLDSEDAPFGDSYESTATMESTNTWEEEWEEEGFEEKWQEEWEDEGYEEHEDELLQESPAIPSSFPQSQEALLRTAPEKPALPKLSHESPSSSIPVHRRTQTKRKQNIKRPGKHGPSFLSSLLAAHDNNSTMTTEDFDSLSSSLWNVDRWEVYLRGIVQAYHDAKRDHPELISKKRLYKHPSPYAHRLLQMSGAVADEEDAEEAKADADERSSYELLEHAYLEIRSLLKNPLPVPTMMEYILLSRFVSSLFQVDRLPRAFQQSSFGRKWGNLLTLGTLHLSPQDSPVTQAFAERLNSTLALLQRIPEVALDIRYHASEREAFRYMERNLNHERAWALVDFSRWPTTLNEDDANITYKIRMNFTTVPSTTKAIDGISPGLNVEFQRYFLSGFLSIQREMNEFALEYFGEQLQNQTADDDYFMDDDETAMFLDPFNETMTCQAVRKNMSAVWTMPMPTPSDRANKFFTTVGYLLSLAMAMAYIFPSSRLIKSIVEEKETRMKELMFIMGVRPWIYWCAWVVTSLLIFSVIAVLLSITLSRFIMEFSNSKYIFFLVFFYSTSTMGFCFTLATFFSRAKLASMMGPIAVFASLLPRFVFFGYDQSQAATQKMIVSLLPATAFAFGADIMAEYEYAGHGIQDWNVNMGDYSFTTSLNFLVLDTILYIGLSWYLDQVVPRDYGAARPVWFLVSPWHWWKVCVGNRAGRTSHSGKSLASGKLSEQDEESMVGDDHQSVSDPSVIAGVQVRDLFKVYKKGGEARPAVNHLNMTLYESQITTLLGHNGAGKSTTISLLTGLFAPTSGDAAIYGHSITHDTDAARHSIGLCPQQNVLFDRLTVLEHVYFFQRIKGIRPTRENSREQAREVGLGDFLHTESSSLSGGNKRKLCVAVAICGSPRFLVFDEPTSGMDPNARRKTWEVLRQRRRGRTILLCTHYMDEAEILSDRVAVLKEGKLQCSGSPMFLKRRFGLGYNLTVVVVPELYKSSLRSINSLGNISESTNEVSYEGACLDGTDDGPEHGQTSDEDDNMETVQCQSNILGSYDTNHGLDKLETEEVMSTVGEAGSLNESNASDQEKVLNSQTTPSCSLHDVAAELMAFVDRRVEGVRLDRISGKEITLRLPVGKEQQFAGLFGDLETNRRELAIGAFGIENASLEEVFLRLAKENMARNTNAPPISEMTPSSEAENMSSSGGDNRYATGEMSTASEDENRASSGNDEQPQETCADDVLLPPGFMGQVALLYWKRTVVQRRDTRGLFCAVFLPAIIVAFVLSVLLIEVPLAGPSMRLSPDLYRKGNGAEAESTDVFVGGGRSSGSASVDSVFLQMQETSNATYDHLNFVRTVNATNSSSLSQYLLDSIHDRDERNTRYGSFVLQDSIQLVLNVDWGALVENMDEVIQSYGSEPVNLTKLLFGDEPANLVLTATIPNWTQTVLTNLTNNGTEAEDDVNEASVAVVNETYFAASALAEFNASKVEVDFANEVERDFNEASVAFVNETYFTTVALLTELYAKSEVDISFDWHGKSSSVSAVYEPLSDNSPVLKAVLHSDGVARMVEQLLVTLEGPRIQEAFFSEANATLMESDLVLNISAGSIIIYPDTKTIEFRDVNITTNRGDEVTEEVIMEDLSGILLKNEEPEERTYRTGVDADVTILHNASSPHAVAAFYQTYSEYLFRQCTGQESIHLSAENHPLPLTNSQNIEVQVILSVLVTLFLLIPFCYVPGAFVVFLVKEKASKSKHLQLASGTSLTAYWTAHYLFDMTLYTILTVCVVGVFLLFRNHGAAIFVGEYEAILATTLLIMGYGFSVLPFSYLIARRYENYSAAQIAVIGIVFVTGFVAVLVYYVMGLLPATKEFAEYLRFPLTAFPAFNLAEGLAAITAAYWEQQILGENRSMPLDWDNAGRLITLEYGLAVPYTLVLLFAEYARDGGSGGIVGQALRYMNDQLERLALRVCGLKEVDGQLLLDDGLRNNTRRDSDVMREEEFVHKHCALLKEETPILIHDLWKVYPPTQGGVLAFVAASCRHMLLSVLQHILHFKKAPQEYRTGANQPKRAVRGLSMAIPKGELLALLGGNGAGKSTTLSILSGDVVPTTGQVYVAGHDATGKEEKNGITLSRRHIGFCPQVDPLLDMMSVRETLTMYGRIRGIPTQRLHIYVQKLLEKLTLLPHAHKMAHSLSGGNKRKLSLGIALIGKPSILLIDESSSGLDPLAKRRMWNLISEVSKDKTVILTTHFMEEAEALCTRAGIMAKGQLQCLGSVQQLKTKFLDGYTVDVFCTSGSTDVQRDRLIDRITREILPGATLSEQQGRFLRFDFSNASSVGLGPTFERLESLRSSREDVVEHYSLSQCSLEQVFVKLLQRADRRSAPPPLHASTNLSLSGDDGDSRTSPSISSASLGTSLQATVNSSPRECPSLGSLNEEGEDDDDSSSEDDIELASPNEKNYQRSQESNDWRNADSLIEQVLNRTVGAGWRRQQANLEEEEIAFEPEDGPQGLEAVAWEANRSRSDSH